MLWTVGDLPLRRDCLLLLLFWLHLRRVGAAVRYIMPQRHVQLLVVVGEDLRVVCAAWDGNVGHAVVEQVFRTQFGVHMDQHAVGGLALAGMAGDGAAGVPNLLFHDLRRTAARNLRRAGVAEGIIMKIGGWKTRSVFERYAIVAQSDIMDAMVKLEAQGTVTSAAAQSEVKADARVN